MTMLLDQDGIRDHLRQRMDSHRWWLFIPLDPAGIEALETIEERFYEGDAEGDFEAILGPVPTLDNRFLLLALGHNRRLSPRKLATFLGQEQGLKLDGSRGTIGAQDVICLAGESGPADQLLAIGVALRCWLYPELFVISEEDR